MPARRPTPRKVWPDQQPKRRQRRPQKPKALAKPKEQRQQEEKVAARKAKVLRRLVEAIEYEKGEPTLFLIHVIPDSDSSGSGSDVDD
jgi:hypothetical protein